MTEVLRERITEPAAWRAADLEADRRWLMPLGAEEASQIIEATQAAIRSGLKVGEFDAQAFDVPLFAERAKTIRDEVEDGLGMVVLRDVPVDRFDIETCKLMYWGLSTHIGTPISQNARGELVAEVTDLGFDKAAANVRGYVTKAGGSPHCDSCDAVSLLCYHPAKSGGESIVASSLTVFNDILETRPDYLPLLEAGFHYDLRGEGVTGDLDETTYNRIPVFSYYQGRMSCRYNAKNILRAAVKRNEVLSEEQKAAIEYVRERARMPENLFRFTMKRGDWQIVSNHTLLHTRTEYDDWPEVERRRRLFRVWFNLPNSRALAPEFADRLNTGPRGGVHIREGAGYWAGASDRLRDQVMPS